MFPVVWATCKPHIWGMSTASLVVCSKSRMNEWIILTAWSAVQEVPLTTFACVNRNTKVIKCRLDIIVELLMRFWSFQCWLGFLLVSWRLPHHCRHASVPSILLTFSFHALCVDPSHYFHNCFSFDVCISKSAIHGHHVVFHILQSFTHYQYACLLIERTVQNPAYHTNLRQGSIPVQSETAACNVKEVISRAFLCTMCQSWSHVNILWMSCDLGPSGRLHWVQKHCVREKM